jgi:hypothetical protein
MTPYRNTIALNFPTPSKRLSALVRAAARLVFMALAILTAMACGALFVAWPSQATIQSSMHMSVGSRSGAVTEDDQLCTFEHGVQSACYVVEASP